MSVESKIVTDIIQPALATLPPEMRKIEAELVMLTIFGQEADFKHRWQVVDDPSKKGPARGLGQFERGGGVKGVLNHSATKSWAYKACLERDLDPSDPNEIWLALEKDDQLAAVFTRLLLWSDAGRMPEVGDEEGAWQLYLRTWRPGAYARGDVETRSELRRKWTYYYERAMVALGL